MTWLLRLLFLVMVFLVVRKIIALIFGGGTRTSRKTSARSVSSSTKAIRGQMVKDPECGMYVASSLALSLEVGGETLYFCSSDCRDAYLRERQLEEPLRS